MTDRLTVSVHADDPQQAKLRAKTQLEKYFGDRPWDFVGTQSTGDGMILVTGETPPPVRTK